MLIVLVTTGFGGYLARVAAAPRLASYPVGSASSPWVQTASPSVVGWFRATSTLTSKPLAASLWVDARDTYRLWINGNVAATNRAQARSGARPIAQTVDVRSLLKPGANVLAVQVSDLGEHNAALWLRLSVRLANGTTVELGTSNNAWRATSNAALTSTRLGDQPGFIQPGYETSKWTRPRPISPVRAITAPIPAEVMSSIDAPTSLSVLSTSSSDAVYRLTLVAPAAIRDSWLRVAAIGALTISVNGRIVSERPAPAYVSPNSHRPTPLWLIDLGTDLHPGANVLTFRVTAARAPALATDTFARVGNSWSRVAVNRQHWTLVTASGNIPIFRTDARRATAAWPNGYIETVVPAGRSQTPWSALGIGALAGLLGSLMILGLSRGRATPGATRRDPGQLFLARLALTLLPGAAVILAALAVGRWITLSPGFAYRPTVVVVAVMAAIAVPIGVSAVALVRRRTHPHPRNGPCQAGATPSSASTSAISSRLWASTIGRWAWATPSRVAVIALAIISSATQSWRLDRQPMWQDEATSVAVARAIHDHGLPHLNSGLYYFKGELYHALLACVLVFTDSTTALRAVSVVWFAATVLAFGLLLMPTLTDRSGLVVAATALLVVVPAELAWARDVRMYQQMQFFAVVFLALYLRALRDGKRRDIVLSAVCMLAMYLSHEESFIILPAVPLTALIAYRTVWANRRIFAAAFGPVSIVIAGQYLLSHIHPVDFGEDLSNRPYVGWDPHQAAFYYQRIFFGPLQQGSMAVLSTLAVLGIVVAARRRDSAQLLLGLTLCATVAATSLVFTVKVDRYSFVTIPMVIALAAIAAARLVDALIGLCTDRRPLGFADDPLRVRPAWVRIATTWTAAVLTLATLATLVVSPRGFGLWVGDLTATSNPLTHPDYKSTVTYLRRHIHPGDQVITLSPPVMTELYLGHRPDRVIQTGRNKLLYLVLHDGRAVETLLGIPVLLTGPQLRTYLEAHHRVWLVSDTGSYAQGVPPDLKDEVRSDFTVVAQDATTTLSLWDIG